MANETKHHFETLGFYPLVLAPFIFFFSLFLMAINVGHVVGILLFGLLSTIFFVNSVAKIEISKNEFLIKRIFFGTSYWDFGEITFRAGGRILAYGGIYGGWIMPLKWRECVRTVAVFRPEEISGYKRASSNTCALFYLFVVPLTLFIVGRIAEYLKFKISPLIWALSWAVGSALSVIAFFHAAPIRIEIGKFNKKRTSVVIGLATGLIIFVSVLLIYKAIGYESVVYLILTGLALGEV